MLKEVVVYLLCVFINKRIMPELPLDKYYMFVIESIYLTPPPPNHRCALLE